MSSELDMWERLFLLGGWQAYELGADKKIRPPKNRGRKRKKKFNPAVISGGVKIKGVKLNKKNMWKLTKDYWKNMWCKLCSYMCNCNKGKVTMPKPTNMQGPK